MLYKSHSYVTKKKSQKVYGFKIAKIINSKAVLPDENLDFMYKVVQI
jgi:hypothetical protein